MLMKQELVKLWQLYGLEKPLPETKQQRLAAALKLAEAEYYHPQCEAAGSVERQRSFCFHHSEVRAKSVLLIHGFTACPHEMRELGEYLFDLGYNVFGVRLAGHGTQVADFARSTRLDWWHSVERGLLVAGLLGETTSVVGESMGGSLAALLGSKYPEMVQSLVLCAPCFEILNPFARATRWRIVQHFLPEVQLGEAVEYWYSAIPSSGVAELTRVAQVARKVAELIVAPTLVIQAKNDQMVRWQGTEEFFWRLVLVPETEKELKLFENGHHNLTVDFNPQKDQVIQWVGDFLGKN